MPLSNNFYHYRTPKSGNEESSFFTIKGRITRSAFFLRGFIALSIYVAGFLSVQSEIFNSLGFRAHIFFETVQIYILPFLLYVFILIQGAKRMHDVNKSGWYFLVPVYNLLLTLSPGTKGNNDYGLDPAPVKKILFFDELENYKKENNDISEKYDTELSIRNSKWHEHVSKIRKENPTKTYQDCLQIAKQSYVKPINTLKVEESTSKEEFSISKVIYTLFTTAIKIGLVILFVIIVIGYFSSEENSAQKTQLSVDASPTDTTHEAVDTATRASETSSDDNSVTAASVLDSDGNKPKDVVLAFLNALNNGNCDAAWNLSLNPNWEQEGREWFCSNEGYGGFSNININEVYTLTYEASSCTVFAAYDVQDINLGNLSFKHNFELEKIDWSNGRYLWMIKGLADAP